MSLVSRLAYVRGFMAGRLDATDNVALGSLMNTAVWPRHQGA